MDLTRDYWLLLARQSQNNKVNGSMEYGLILADTCLLQCQCIIKCQQHDRSAKADMHRARRGANRTKRNDR
eukprot:6178386-Pleurochrysis_carterae.AAC.6